MTHRKAVDLPDALPTKPWPPRLTSTGWSRVAYPVWRRYCLMPAAHASSAPPRSTWC